MFSLIITIISIALVTALALATIYYGGSAFRQGGDAAAAAKLINEGQQLSGAAAIVEATGETNAAFTQQALVDAKGLQSKISSYAETAVDRGFTSLTATDIKAAVCLKVNEKAGLSTTAAVALADVKNYGCVTTGPTADGQVVFKY
jgi:hypothetical protein